MLPGRLQQAKRQTSHARLPPTSFNKKRKRILKLINVPQETLFEICCVYRKKYNNGKDRFLILATRRKKIDFKTFSRITWCRAVVDVQEPPNQVSTWKKKDDGQLDQQVNHAGRK